MLSRLFGPLASLDEGSSATAVLAALVLAGFVLPGYVFSCCVRASAVRAPPPQLPQPQAAVASNLRFRRRRDAAAPPTPKAT